MFAAADVDLDVISTITEGFSGADLNELCQRASKCAIRQSIEEEARLKAIQGLDPNAAQKMGVITFF